MNELDAHAAVNGQNQIAPWQTVESLQQLIEAAPVAIVTVDRAGIIVYVNQKLEDLFGYARAELINQPVELLLPEQFRTIHVQHRAAYVAEPHVRAMGSGMNLVGRGKDGTTFPLEAGLSAVTIDDDMLIVASIVDITIRKQTEEMLEQRVQERTIELERRRRVADGLRDILAVLNSDQPLAETLAYMVAQADMLLGADACAIFRIAEEAETVDVQVSQGLADTYLTQAKITLSLETYIGRVVLTRQPLAISDIAATLADANAESQLRRQALLVSGYRAFMVVPLLIKGDVYGALALYYTTRRDFTAEEIELATTFGDQAGLAIENAHLRTQAAEAAVLAERNRIARDLHDSVTQTLFSANIIADILPRLWDRNEEQGQRRLAELHGLTHGALAEMRTMLLELRPAMLENAALDEVLQQLVDATTTRARLPITLDMRGNCNGLPPAVRVALYRITQEALNNVAKYAQATTATVELRCLAERADLSISDDGIGFVIGQVAGNHQGLTIMRERADEIGATLTITTSPGDGTKIAVLWYNSPNTSQ